MALNVEEQGKFFEFTEKIGKALYVAKIVLRQSYILKTEFIKANPTLHENPLEETSLVPMDISVRAVATAENVEDHLKQMHTALRHCLGLLICYIEKDEHDHGKRTDLIGVSRSFVRVQMEQLIYDIKDLLAGPGSHLDTTPHPHEQCTSEARAQMSGFQFNTFSYRVLDEIPLWMQLVVRNLMVYRVKKEEHEMEAIKR